MLMQVPTNTSVEGKHAALAAELGARILPLPDILKRYNISAAELKVLLKDEQFRHMVADFRREWHSPMSARDRVRVKAALAVEDGLIDLHQLFLDPEITPSARLDAYKQLVQLADMQPKRDDVGGPSAGFSITINIPRENEPMKTITLDQEAEVVDEPA
jgi:hypothetical protein